MLHAHARDETRSNCLFLRFLHRARVQSKLFHWEIMRVTRGFHSSCRHVANLNTILCFFCRMLFCRMLLIRKNNHWHTNFIKVSLIRDRNISRDIVPSTKQLNLMDHCRVGLRGGDGLGSREQLLPPISFPSAAPTNPINANRKPFTLSLTNKLLTAQKKT